MTAKDKARIANIFARSNGYASKAVHLAETMAKSIKSVKKAKQRGAAVTEVEAPVTFTEHDVALVEYIFDSRVAELNGAPPLKRPEPVVIMPPVIVYKLEDLRAQATRISGNLRGAGSNTWSDASSALKNVRNLIDRAVANGGTVEVQPPAPWMPTPLRYVYPEN